MTGTILWLEIQEGKHRVSTKKYQQEIGATAVCVFREVHKTGVSNTLPNCKYHKDDAPTKLFLGDSWFGSVKAAANVQNAGIMTAY